MKKVNKKWLSFFGILSVLVLLVGIAIPQIRTVADDTRGGNTSGSGGNTSGGHSVTSGSFSSVSTMGYRLYFADDTLQDDGHFSSDTYSKMCDYTDIALYQFYNWDGGSIGAGSGIATWSPNYDLSQTSYCIQADLNSVFGFTNQPTAVDLSQSVDATWSDGNNFRMFGYMADEVKAKQLNVIFTYYINYLANNYSSLSPRQQDQYNALKTKDVNTLMLVCEPVFVNYSPDDGFCFTISNCDWGGSGWGGGLYAIGGMVSSRITDKLNQFWTDFTANGVQFNPPDGRWNGFCVYDRHNALDSNKFSVGFNVNLQYNGEIKQNLTTGDNITTSLSETETAPSAYTEESKTIGDQRYTDALSSWDKLNGDYDSNGYTLGNLYMAGWTWNSVAYSGNGSTIQGIPWSGANKATSVNNLKMCVPDSMKDKITGSTTDYVLGVYGNMDYNAVQAIADNQMYITNNTAITLQVQDGITGSARSPYSDANWLNSLKQNIQDNVKAITTEKAVTSSTEGLAFGSTFRVGFTVDQPSVANGVGGEIQQALSSTGFTVTGMQDLASLDADCTNTDYPKYQETPQQVQEMLARIKGATVYAKPINYDGQKNVDSYKVLSGSEMTLSVTSMGKKTPVDSYMASASIGSDVTNQRTAYTFKTTGQTYTNTHLAQSPTHWDLNPNSISTIGQAVEDGQHFAIVWRNNDMKGHDNFDLSYTDRASKAQAIATGIASCLSSNGTLGVDENSSSNLSNAFFYATGVHPLSVGYLGDGDDMYSSIDLGSAFDGNGNLSGLSVLVLSVGGGTTETAQAEDGLPANMLNIIAPSALGLDSTSQRIEPMVFSKYEYGSPVDWSITQTLSGDIHDFAGTKLFYYNESGTGNFGEPSQTKKWFSCGEKSYPSYAYNLTRSLWGDLPTASNFRGATADNTSSNSSYRNFIQNDMKFPIGTVPSYGVTCNVGANVEEQYSEFKQDTFQFEGKVVWWTGHRHPHRHTAYNRRNYYMTHKMNKYTAMDIGLATVPDDKTNILYQNNEDRGRDNDFTYWSAISDQSNSVLTIYPEVNMLMQYPSGNLDVDTVDNVYVMGEKARTLKPVAIRGIKVHNQGIQGEFSTDTAAVGKNASKLSKDNGNLPVVYTGGNINLHIDNIGQKFDLVSYALDLRDNADNGVSIKSAFSGDNDSYNPQEEHETYVNNTLKNLEVDVTLDIDKDRDGGDNLYRYHNFNTMLSNFTIDDESQDAYNITYKHGEIDKSADGWKSFISDLADEYGVSKSQAEDIFKDSEMEGQLQRALESSEDGTNNSHYAEGMSGSHWYDEECSVLTIKKYKTVVNMGDIALSDKLDITTGDDSDSKALKQDADRNNLFSTKAFGKWYLTMYLKNDIGLQNGEDCKDSQYQKLWEEKYVDGADFIVSDASTNDMRN